MKLVLGDDHRMFLDALTTGLERRGHDVVGSSNHLDGLVELVERWDPDLCVLDVDFDGRSVIGVAAVIRNRKPDVSIVLLSGTATQETWLAFESGVVDGVVNKVCDLSVLNRTLERVRAGERVVERFARPARPRRSTCEATRLSGRERAVMSLLVRGASTPQMAEELGVSTHTVRTHVQSLMRKLGVNSRTKAASKGVALGLVDPIRAGRSR
jgi:DNA-binding NarL/FixJ family response regulator